MNNRVQRNTEGVQGTQDGEHGGVVLNEQSREIGNTRWRTPRGSLK